MDSESEYQDEIESLRAKLAKLEKEDHDNLVSILRYRIGDVEGLDGLQIYIRFKLEVMNLHESYRPEKSSWPIFLLEIFTPHSVHWPDEARSQKIIEFQDIITEFEYKLKTNESNFSDCDESIESDIGNGESQFCESENSNQQYDNVHNEV